MLKFSSRRPLAGAKILNSANSTIYSSSFPTPNIVLNKIGPPKFIFDNPALRTPIEPYGRREHDCASRRARGAQYRPQSIPPRCLPYQAGCCPTMSTRTVQSIFDSSSQLLPLPSASGCRRACVPCTATTSGRTSADRTRKNVMRTSSELRGCRARTCGHGRRVPSACSSSM